MATCAPHLLVAIYVMEHTFWKLFPIQHLLADVAGVPRCTRQTHITALCECLGGQLLLACHTLMTTRTPLLFVVFWVFDHIQRECVRTQQFPANVAGVSWYAIHTCVTVFCKGLRWHNLTAGHTRMAIITSHCATTAIMTMNSSSELRPYFPFATHAAHFRSCLSVAHIAEVGAPRKLAVVVREVLPALFTCLAISTSGNFLFL